MENVQCGLSTMSKQKNKLMTGIKTVENDEEIWTLNDEIQDLYSSFYKIDYEDKPVYFGKEEKLNKDKMLGLIKKLIVRIEQIIILSLKSP